MKGVFKRIKSFSIIPYFLGLYQESDLDLSSIAVAYYMLLTVFPFLVLLANILPYVAIDTQQVLTFMAEHLPSDLYETFSGLVQTIFEERSTSLVWLSVATGLWTMAKSMTFLQKSVNKAYGVTRHRGFIWRYLFGLVNSLLVLFFLTLAILLSTFGKSLLTLAYTYLGFQTRLYDLLLQLNQPVTGLVFFLALVTLYYLLPNVHIGRLRYILPGSVFATVVLLTMTSLFGHYVTSTMQNVENLRHLGSVTLFAVMIWFIVFAKVIITGAILNAAYQKKEAGPFQPRLPSKNKSLSSIRPNP